MFSTKTRLKTTLEDYMRNLIAIIIIAVLIFSIADQSGANTVIQLSENVSLIPGPVNGVSIEQDNARLVVYGDPAGKIANAEIVMFTHSRRDVVWAGRKLVENGAKAVVPDGDIGNFTNVEQFWDEFTTRRFHDYAQQGTKILTKPLKISRTVKAGENFSWRGIPIEVIDTPGYTRQALSYLIEIDGIKYAFVGDIIYGNGKLFDLYSLQDAVPEAKIGGYHGWAGRMGILIDSLRKVADKKPDILVPARGPVIRNPSEAINLLIERLQAVYENYLSISAGRWYFRDNYDILARRVLGQNPKVNWMLWAEVIKEKPPEWIIPISNARLIISEDRRGFLIDCGSRRIVEEVIKLKDAGKLTGLDGLFITHYHDDHTDNVAACLAEFNCPVYATGPGVDILEHPGDYRLPCLTPNPIVNIKVMPEAHKMRWKEFTFTFHDFPGQTIYHDALLVEKDNAEKIFFIGDSFTPSGIDDYCLLNRNLLHESMGYFYCLNLIKKIPNGTLLINEHVVEPFSFNARQLDHMTATLTKRKALLAELLPWDEPNYGIDERWVRFSPYGSKTKPGRNVKISLKIFNHYDTSRTHTFALNLPHGFDCEVKTASVTIPPRTEKQTDFNLVIDTSVEPGTYVITADVQQEQWNLPRWTEAIIEVE
jgi:glyoxylase-like metal-dependent hydrolase (beta-lactamase superfamily II)